MGLIWVEVFLISAHGLQHSTSLLKRQWFAVAWIDVNSKYCTKVVDSGNSNPVWRTKFAIPVDNSVPNIQDLTLNVEVYSIDAIFFKEKLHGSATIVLKEFLVKQVKNYDVSKPRQEEVGSYQLRKKQSSTPRGFIDILISISEDKKEPNSYQGNKESKMLSDCGHDTITTERKIRQAYPEDPQASIYQPENHVKTNVLDSHSVPFTDTNYSDPYVDESSYYVAAGPSYQFQPPRIRTPPSPPPPSSVGCIPTYVPRNDGFSLSYVDMPPSREAPGPRAPPSVTMGIDAEALAAGAVIFGDDFLSGFNVPPGLGDADLNLGFDPTF